MSRRFGEENTENIDKQIEECTPDNTKKSRLSIWNQFSTFCRETNYELNATTSVIDIAHIMKDWAFNMKKVDGTDYKETVIKLMWNSTAKQVQELYFKSYDKKFDPFKDIEFKAARDARDAKRRKLQAIPNKRKKSSVALSEEEYEKIVNVWDENTPDGLQRKFFHIAGYELAWRGGEASTCTVQYFKEEKDNENIPTGRIEYNPLFTKTTQGGSKNLADSKWLIPNTSNSDICPVRLFKKLLENRPKLVTTDRLFLTPNPTWNKLNSKGWYKNIPVGRNHLSKWMKTSAQKIGLDVKKTKITNHSNRATAISHLAKAGVGEEQLIKISGHSNTHSIRPYLQLDKEHHSELVQAMREKKNQETAADTLVNNNLSANTSSPQVTYVNCNFTCHNLNNFK